MIGMEKEILFKWKHYQPNQNNFPKNETNELSFHK